MTDPTAPRGPTKQIIVASFSTTEGARGGLDRLRGAGARLGNAAIVKRLVDGRVEFTETQDWGVGKSALVGALAALVLPGIGPILGAVAGGAAAHFIDAGFPDPLLRQLGIGIGTGTSMLIALVEQADQGHAEQILTDGGATILGSGLEADLGRAMEAIRAK